jgi:pimeloyl-ACP methyl ester carboxylesterase
VLSTVALAAAAAAGTDPAAKCVNTKAKTAGKKSADYLKAFGKDAVKPNGAKLAASLSKAESKFQGGFSKAEGKGGCPGEGDAAAVEALVDDFVRDLLCEGPLGQQTVTIPATSHPAETPGTLGVDNSAYPKLVTMFGGTSYSLNNATYTRYYCGGGAETPDAILILVPGFEGGAGNFAILAANTIPRARVHGVKLEIWAYDRRGHQIEDLAGLDVAESSADGLVALDWLFGAELGFSLHPDLVAGPNRRAEFHDAASETAFIGNWTNLVFSRDINDVVDVARTIAVNQNVFLGGHSAGTGFTARYASTDFDLSGGGPADPGYAKLRGLVILEGSGGSSAGDAPSAQALDQMEDKADGGLFAAVRDQAPRCVDGTPCTDDSDCLGKGQGTCTEPVAAYATVPGILNPRIIATGEISSIQAITDPDTGQALAGVDFGPDRCVSGTNDGMTCTDDTDCPGGTCLENDAVRQVADLASLATLGDTTAFGGLGNFLDDDGFISSLATFVRTSLGAPGPTVGGLQTWQEITEGGMPPSVLPNNGPAPTTLPGAVWGQEKEVTRLSKVATAFYEGGTNFADWYYPSSGPSTTSGLPSLDSSALSVGRSRRDIENITQAGNIDIPVICFGGTNGATPVPGRFVPFAQSLGTCTAPSCDGTTARVVDAMVPNEAFPTLGGVAGGFEVHMSEGYAHLDILTAEDGTHNQVIGPLVDFVTRNVQ